jgi:uncharacterized integral membrane protein
MRWVLNIVGALLILVGTWWILQGTGIVPIGFMANQVQWALTGIVLDVVAVGLLILANRSRKKLAPSV